MYWRVMRCDRRWRIAGLEMLYHKDTLAPVDPAYPIAPAGVAAAAAFRPSYRNLAAMLHATGRELDQELPGTDRPDPVDALPRRVLTWLA